LKPEDDIDTAADNISADLDVDMNAGDGADMSADNGMDNGADAPNDMPEPPPIEEPTPEPASDDIEVDVTSLVKGSEEAKDAADTASKNSEMLLQKLNDLEARMANMTALSDKIEGLEKEIIKRNPTPVEKLEMRSLSSYPFNQKLTDYWADKKGVYDVMDNEKKPKEYVLTKKDIDSSYNDVGIRKTFSVDDNPYDEESIQDYSEEDL
jgi:hypothetical protein